MTRTRLVGAALAASLLLAGCAAQPTTPPAETVCTARAQLEASLEAFRDLDPDTASTGDYQSAWFAVREDFLELRDYRYELADANVTALNDAIEDLGRALDALPDDISIADALDSLLEEREAVATAYSALSDELNCPQ